MMAMPLIMFYAGFSLKKKMAFKNMLTITVFGVVGCCATGALAAHVTSSCLHSAAAATMCLQKWQGFQVCLRRLA